jgi:general secretion pathway protein K
MFPTRAIARKPDGARSQRGFVLLVVLSALGLLAVVAATFAQVARNHIRLAAVANESAKAEAFADAGINIAILDLVAARQSQAPNRRFALDATPLACSIGSDGATLTISIRDEAGKVDLNIGSEPLLRALLLGVGLKDAAVDAILDFRDEDDDRRVSGAERAEYLAAGRSHGPRNGAFLAVEELASVLGITQADADRLRPFVTIHSGLTAIDTGVAPKGLIEILAQGIRNGPSLLADRTAPGGLAAMGAPLPSHLLAASTRRAFSVRSEARMPGGARFVREAVVEFVAAGQSAFQLRRWHRGAAGPGGALAQALPPC